MQPFVSVDEPLLALAHVRVIDGTGAAPREDQTIVVVKGRITAVGAKVAIPKGARVLDLRGKTVIPGLVGMHEHLFWPAHPVVGFTAFDESFFVPQPYSFPRLYLAAGVTTARTAGSVSPFTDLAVKRQIDAGTVPGPRLDVTGPYIEGAQSPFVQFPRQSDAAVGHAPRRLLGAGRRHVVQGLQLRHPRRARRRHRRRARARAQGRRPPVLDRLPRRGRRRHRQPRARPARRQRVRSRQAARALSAASHLPASTRSTSRARRCRR